MNSHASEKHTTQPRPQCEQTKNNFLNSNPLIICDVKRIIYSNDSTTVALCYTDAVGVGAGNGRRLITSSRFSRLARHFRLTLKWTTKYRQLHQNKQTRWSTWYHELWEATIWKLEWVEWDKCVLHDLGMSRYVYEKDELGTYTKIPCIIQILKEY